MIYSITITKPDNDKLITNIDSDLYDFNEIVSESNEIVLTNPAESGFIVQSIEGLDAPDTDINFKNVAGFDGGIFSSSRSQVRVITITLIPVDNQDVEQNRHKAYRLFPLQKKIRLIFKTDERHVFIDGYVGDTDVNFFGTKASDLEKVIISVKCPIPWFYGVDYGHSMIYGIEPLFSFPFESIGVESYTAEVNVEHEGDIIGITGVSTSNSVLEDRIFSINITKDSMKTDSFPSASIETMFSDVNSYVFPDGYLPLEGIISDDILKGEIVTELPQPKKSIFDRDEEYFLDITKPSDGLTKVYEVYKVFENGVIVDELPEDPYPFCTYYRRIKPGESLSILYRSYKYTNSKWDPESKKYIDGIWVEGRHLYNEPKIDYIWAFINRIRKEPPESTDIDMLPPDKIYGENYSRWLESCVKDWDEFYTHSFKFKVLRNYPEDRDLVMSILKNTAYGSVYYNGEIDIGVVFKIHAFGAAKNISIYDFDNNSYMKIYTDLFSTVQTKDKKTKLDPEVKASDDLIISTVKGNKYAYLFRDGEYYDIINCIDRTSTWFQVGIGDNYFAIVAQEGIDNINFSIDYYIAYEGL